MTPVDRPDPIEAKSSGETLRGIAVSHGMVVAPAVVVGPNLARFPRARIATGAVAASREWKRYGAAVCQVESDLRVMIDKLEVGHVEASILEVYLLMVGDETFAREVHQLIHERRRCADWAVDGATEELALQLRAAGDPYLSQRSRDIEFVGERLLRALGGVQDPGAAIHIDEPSVVVARDLSPADTAAMAGAPVVGFVAEVGSRTSHTSIMARALGIPAVVGVADALTRIGSGDRVVVDGLRGRVIVDPSERQIADAEQRAGRLAEMAEQLRHKRHDPATTHDAVVVRLNANIELAAEAAVALEHGADGVGLYRTEFLYMNRSEPPDEDDQLDSYSRVVDCMQGRPVTLRTFDIGGDKFVTGFQTSTGVTRTLGLRAVRLALAEQDMFLTQLRAIVRASAHGEVRVMLPLVSTLDELERVRELLAEAKFQVRQRGEPQAEEIPLGVMIEVPAAAVMADVFAKHADFMSIGTNDLVQFALAIDRTDGALARLASPFDPAILRLVNGVVTAAIEQRCPVSVCGEMASDLCGALLLIGIGVRDLSMEAATIPEVKEAIQRVSAADMQQLADEALALPTATEVRALVADRLRPRLLDLLTGHPPGGRPSRSSIFSLDD